MVRILAFLSHEVSDSAASAMRFYTAHLGLYLYLHELSASRCLMVELNRTKIPIAKNGVFACYGFFFLGSFMPSLAFSAGIQC